MFYALEAIGGNNIPFSFHVVIEQHVLDTSGNSNWGERFSKDDLLIKIACYVQKVNDIFKIKKS